LLPLFLFHFEKGALNFHFDKNKKRLSGFYPTQPLWLWGEENYSRVVWPMQSWLMKDKIKLEVWIKVFVS